MKSKSVIFPEDSVKKLLKIIIPFENNTNEFFKKKDRDNEFFYINTRNYEMLYWYFVKKNKMPHNEFIKNIPEKYKKIIFQKNKKVPNIISLIIFKNIDNYFKNEKNIFFKAGYETTNKFKILSKEILLLIVGKNIKNIIKIVKYISYQYNNTKFFNIKTEKLGKKKKVTCHVIPIYGIINTKPFIEWNNGIFTAFIENSNEKIINYDYKINSDGSWSYFFEYIPKKIRLKKIRNLLISKKIKEYKKKEKELADIQLILKENTKLEINNIIQILENLAESCLPHAQHSEDVTFIALLFGKQLGISPIELKNLAIMAYLHDIGKTNIPHTILRKKGKFEGEEYEVMKIHAILGLVILLNRGFPLDIAFATTEHQERTNGLGYPFGIKLENTSINGLILQISDVCAALLAKRAYKEEFSTEKVIKILKESIKKNDFYKPFGDFFIRETFPILIDLINNPNNIKKKVFGYFLEINNEFEPKIKFENFPKTKIYTESYEKITIEIIDYFNNLRKKIKTKEYLDFINITLKFILEKKNLKKISRIENDEELDLFIKKIGIKINEDMYELRKFFNEKIL